MVMVKFVAVQAGHLPDLDLYTGRSVVLVRACIVVNGTVRMHASRWDPPFSRFDFRFVP